MSAVKVGIVGLGQRGLQHLNSLWRIADADIVALCDPAPDNLSEEKISRYVDGFTMGAIRTYTNFSDFFNSAGLDAIYFAIPPSLHDGEVLRAAEKGLHLFIEKPVSLYLNEALEMQHTIDKAGIISTVGFNQRHDNWHGGVRDFLKTKRLVMMTYVVNGTLESHSVKHTRTEAIGGPQNRVWAANRSWSGGTIVEAGIHQTDLMRFWAGDIAWTEARYIHRDADDIEDGGDNPYAYSVTYGFESGMIANLLMCRLRKTFWGDSYQDITWDYGHLKIEGDGPVAYYYDGPYPPPEGKVDQAGLRHPLELGARNDNTFEISRAFIEAVKERSEAPLFNTFASSINSHAAVLGANVSDDLDGKRVVLKELLESGEYAKFRQKPSE
ncbi:MAG: putative dehydrogenase [Planctomycetota bacterium]|jgi:predicted dehydrogenase